MKLELARRLALGNEGEGAQIGDRGAHGFQLHLARGLRAVAELGAHPRTRIVEQADPVMDEAALARGGIMEHAGQRGMSAAALAMAHDDDFLDLQLGHRKFERGRDAVMARRRLERRNQIGDVAHDENLAGQRVEDLRGLDAAVGAGNDHQLGRLALGQRLPAFALATIIRGPEPLIAIEQVGEIGHGYSVRSVKSARLK